jgi:hypothetical protein
LTCAVAAALGSMATTAQAAVTLSHDGLGQVLLFPYYTVRNGWDSLFNITNTGNKTVAIKVRFKEALNSRDVLDFTAVLSPKDVFTGWVTQTPNGPVFMTDDNTCTVPGIGPGTAYPNGFPFSSNAYGGPANPGAADGGPTTLDRAVEGYVTVITEGQMNDNNDDPNDGFTTISEAAHMHNAAGCGIIDSYFADVNTTPADAGNPKTYVGNQNKTSAVAQLANPSNEVLKGNYNLVQKAKGLAAGGNATALVGFTDEALVYSQSTAASDQVEPNLNSGTSQSIVYNDKTHRAYVDTWNRPVDAVSAALMRTHVYNEWSTNPAGGVQTNWVVTFPTKNYYVDAGTSAYASLHPAQGNSADDWAPPIPPFANEFAESSKGAKDGKACTPVTYYLYDRSENVDMPSGTALSPAPEQDAHSLCYETNVLSFGDSTNLLHSNVAQNIDISGLNGAQYGWMDLDLRPANSPSGDGEFGTGGRSTLGGGPGCHETPSSNGTDNYYGGACNNQYYGLPVIGFAIKTRNYTGPTVNYGIIADHSYNRGIESLSQGG